MEWRVKVAIILCIVITSLPFLVDYLINLNLKNNNYNLINNDKKAQILYIGQAISRSYNDILYVTPAKVYVPKVNEIVSVNVIIKFKHSQPCKGDWKISAENLNNVVIVKESGVRLVNLYTAEKQYRVKVLGNGSMDIVFRYNCPYGIEERVTVYFYLI